MRYFLFGLLFLSCLAVAQNNLPDAPHIYVEGSAEIKLDPDTLRLTGTIESLSLDAAEAERQVYEKSAILLKACKGKGINPDQIKASAIQMSPDYEYSGGRQRFMGYEVSRDFEITLTQLDKYYPTLRAIVESKAASSLDATFSKSDTDELINQVQLAAFDDAHRRAERLATKAGKRLGGVYSITEFNLRAYEQEGLLPQRFLFESKLGNELAEIVVTARKVEAYGYAEPLFKADQAAVTATVFVVFLLEDK